MTRNDVIAEIKTAFSLTDETAETACLLLEARARTLDFSFAEYIERYHPEGIARNESLPEHFNGYVQFLGDDAQAVLRAGRGADFSTFVHECAHVFRRQLSGELREQAEAAFGIENGEWSEGKEEDFARGLERWLEKRRHKNEAKREVYRKGEQFVDTVYRSIEHIVDIDPRMEAVYERLFEDNKYKFNREQFDGILQQTAEGILPETSHVFLGMTPRIYEDIGLERLPMAITAKHLYTTLRKYGKFDDAHYHDLGLDILRQIPEQLKKPLCVVQSPNEDTEIISIIELKDKNNNPVIVPIAQFQKGFINNAELDINLVKTIFGKTGFEQWLETAANQNRLLYLNKKETELALNENLITLSKANSILTPEHRRLDTQDVSGFYADNITRYREAVKAKFGERPAGLRRLYQRTVSADGGQLAFDFSAPLPAPDREPTRKPEALPVMPYPNTPEYYLRNFAAASDSFKSDPIEAGRYLLRLMTKEDRDAALTAMREAGCTDKESYHAYLRAALPESRTPASSETESIDFQTAALLNAIAAEPQPARSKEITQDGHTPQPFGFSRMRRYNGGIERGFLEIAKEEREKEGLTLTEKQEQRLAELREETGWVTVSDFDSDIAQRIKVVKPAEDVQTAFIHEPENRADTFEEQPFGAWTDFNRRLSVRERELYNTEALKILNTKTNGPLGETERAALSRYSGFGGISAEGERGVLYDYYTSPPVARMVWSLLEKAGAVTDGAKVLEPSCGTGVFIQTAPADTPLSITGVELDRRTAAIARLLHSNAEIHAQSFEAFNISDTSGGFDVVIGNAPFGERGAATTALDMPDEKNLDRYFVSRSIDNLKDGGLMALIVAPGVLENASNESFRLAMLKKAQFTGALRLPDHSFHHSHTGVQPDILFFRKYPDDIRSRLEALSDTEFRASSVFDDAAGHFAAGTYYSRFPEHLIGTLSQGTGQWGADELKGNLTPEIIQKTIELFSPAQPVAEHILFEIKNRYSAPKIPPRTVSRSLNEQELANLQSNTLRQGAFKIDENRVYILSGNNQWSLSGEGETLAKKLSHVSAISQMLSLIREHMRDEGVAEKIAALQKNTRELLASFTEQFGSLPLDDADLKRFTREHPAVRGVYEAFLHEDDPILHEATIYRTGMELVDGHNQAVQSLLSLRQSLTAGTEENIRAAFPGEADNLLTEMRANPDIFITPEGEWLLREDFVQGDAWNKIDALRTAAESETTAWKKEKLRYGADEIEKAVGWTPIEDADFSPRSSWIPLHIIREWVSSEDGLDQVGLDGLAKNDADKWGTKNGGAWEELANPLVYYLNGQKQRSSTIDTETYNREHDDLFRSYIANHSEFRRELENIYNRNFKTHIQAPVKTYPVHIEGWRNPGANGGKEIQPHQWQSIHHLYRQGRGISALGTGFGKTVTAIGLMSLMRQEGKTHRVWLQVPNNKVKDWIAEIKDVMPNLNIASIDPEEPGYSSRDKRYAKYQEMARGNADIIIMPESAASEIQLSPENDEHITSRVAALYRAEREKGSERQKELAELHGERKARNGKTNLTVSFEDFGCDALIVDEAHRYKNLFSSTLSRETGMNDGRQSAKAMALYKKSEYIREHNNEQNVFLLTATPLTNSPLEYYNMLQYIAPDELRRLNVTTIDGFIREFARIENGWIYDWSHSQTKQGRILTGFKNLSSLQDLFFTYTDLQNNPDAIGLEKPDAKNHPNVIPSNPAQMGVLKGISEKLDRYRTLESEDRAIEFPGQNFLTFYSQMRTASLDLELYDPQQFKSWNNPKLETLAKNARESFEKTKGGQVIFCDRVFSSDTSFNMHEKIKQALVSQGFKEKDVVIVNGFTKSGGSKSDSAVEKEVSKAIADYNSGKYKVIIGSTACIGEGVNLQKNSAALHHFDIPFRPSDFIQRNGRIDRQGNEQEQVALHTYLAAGTIDNYSVNLVQRKANWIDQLLRTKSDVFTNPNNEDSVDADELLLALTEEWGDKDAVQKRREEMERIKQEKITEAQTKQMQAHLKNLSLTRGSLESLAGKENTVDYKKRAEQIHNLEAALANNPVFTKHDLLDSREPFLYDARSNMIFRKGDVFTNSNGVFTIEGFNYKKQELKCRQLLSESEQIRKKSAYHSYGEKFDDKRTFTVSDLGGGRGWRHNKADIVCEKADAESRNAIEAATGSEFYSLPDALKEKHYDLHIKLCSGYYHSPNPLLFMETKDGKLKLETTSWDPEDTEDALLNPFSDAGRQKINAALEKGLVYEERWKDNILESLEQAAPALTGAVVKTMERQEAEQLAVQAAERKALSLKKQAILERLDNTNKNIEKQESAVVRSGRRR